ncbi:MBL fold metallo-hydrolase [Caldimonas thermodepolymerans]|jgi:Zn-dependent hydrolases, including glyoxylases|uniref:Glyoxylase-like metal-dependent hydrolase (Beta-lactamase superfamily II) n=1 Tax=Caldimonas thermodepolymerans TaxID=215580 RepID=A0A2S5T225_9BURK|nr:MBL fold metallo-hydrolase [Caldimonas thermodepolymerans]PPE69071.1 Zn-dependent hydrolase [Caldimonas thermodepolymerans]QPC32106.1 MBL fold metallo-hydrolase [Caldimonas thermodepolymerans]RDH95877.1 glyoxylase-like metal-dependent hydrolase (beta-lactamase superfamily II) [Caldimonas thermodepolymerans]TCP08240.1 glyoxylase-like metal-dependent hydrolase (beta-lactamase superfamily II) [Caldimonas thermodepolymerans]UZG44903.1 MBL fold metallo-hydrolase [Caldimonas thermodepolymerans]
MNELEHRLQYPHGERIPAPGHTLEVAPGVRWVRMGLPFALDHINLWLLRDEQDGRAGWTVVDCGITDDATRAAWERVFEHELDGLPVLRVIVTHMHPDHIGLAHWLTERWQCRLWISATDFNAARVGSQTTTGYGGESAASFFASHGLTDPDSVAKVRARSNYYASMVPRVPAQYRRLMDGDVLDIGGRAWRCISGYGHAPEHISLYCDELHVLLSGDMVLPRISTNVSVFDMEPEGNPLPLYLASLDRLSPLPEDTLVLPAHGRPFRGLHERVRQLHDHHDARLADVMQACRAAPCSAADILPVLFHRKLDLHQTTFAMGEAIAHLHALWLGGRLKRTAGSDGVYRFAPA